ncbi:esterase-like activity of phytase family protein [Synechococcus sp. R6-10]|uniref:esterase-like activity of phytase family protein n=1 Tax=Synechococcus sp. R6-10 TaxID=2291956 RepID=UPI0039C275D4
MRTLLARLGLGIFLGMVSTRSVSAAEAVKATLAGYAVLPAMSFVPPPSDAGSGFVVSGRFAAINNQRVEEIASVEGKSFVDGRTTGISLPFVGQPIQGFSGIETLARDRFRVLIDNGFGSKANSPDALLSFHEVAVDWENGQVRLTKSVFLQDPNKVIPFRIANEFTTRRYLTGADLDPESIQTIGDLHWIGDEFGPYLIATDGNGKVVAFFETEVDGKVVRSPDHHTVTTPATPGAVNFEARRSRGFEGMAASPDGRFLYAMLEGPLYLGEPPALETVGDKEVLRILEFNVEERKWTGKSWKYPLEVAGNNIGDFNMIDATRALVIERDSNEGDPRLACKGEQKTDCFPKAAEFKRVYLIDLAQADSAGLVKKVAYIDLLDIADPKGIGKTATVDGRFTFPFVTIENVDVVDDQHIVVANDNNLPFSAGRLPNAADANEFILLNVGNFFTLR